MRIIPWKDSDNDWFPSRKDSAINLYETDEDIIAEIETMGINPDKVDVLVSDDYIEVRGEKEEKKREKRKSYFKKSSFEKKIKIPLNVKKEEIKTVNEKGTIKIVMPKE